MPDISSEKTTATTYPPTRLYDSWCNHADDLNMPVSQYIIRMVEAGRKQVDLQDTTSDSIRALRQQQTSLKRELERQRARNAELERQLEHTIHSEIVKFVSDCPGVSMSEIIQHIADTVPGRVARFLDMLEGDEIEISDGEYYPVAQGTEES